MQRKGGRRHTRGRVPTAFPQRPRGRRVAGECDHQLLPVKRAALRRDLPDTFGGVAAESALSEGLGRDASGETQALVEGRWREKPPDRDSLVRAAKARDAAKPLRETQRSPWQIEVDDGVGVLKIEAFAHQIGAMSVSTASAWEGGGA